MKVWRINRRTVLPVLVAAGADALYAPGLTKAQDIRAVFAAVQKPVNVVMGLSGASFSISELEAMGVRRISVGSALSRGALAAVAAAAKEMRTQGTFTFAKAAMPYRDINDLMRTRSAGG